jgi:hypothetical protein
MFLLPPLCSMFPVETTHGRPFDDSGTVELFLEVARKKSFYEEEELCLVH